MNNKPLCNMLEDTSIVRGEVESSKALADLKTQLGCTFLQSVKFINLEYAVKQDNKCTGMGLGKYSSGENDVIGTYTCPLTRNTNDCPTKFDVETCNFTPLTVEQIKSLEKLTTTGTITDTEWGEMSIAPYQTTRLSNRILKGTRIVGSDYGTYTYTEGNS